VVGRAVLANQALSGGGQSVGSSCAARTRGADVLIYFQNGTNNNELSKWPDQETGQQYRAAPATLESGG